MTTSIIPDRYDPAATERDIYARWVEAGVFRADAEAALNGAPTFVIVMPPPNVTAILHVGHGLNNTVQDVLIRWRRMAGDDTLWMPGTDHAGIATQNVIEKQLLDEGKSRHDLGREAFLERTREFVRITGGEILRQLEAIGSSADWSRTAYTFSPQLSIGVREAFVRLYEKGLVYRGHRVIHWCPRCLTALSDEEAEFKDEMGKLYHVRYRLSSDPARALTIATTRPETILADVAVAVHPGDDRYRALVGQMVRVPIANVDVPIIADEYVDPAFGTGALKITPAHDANDFDVGVRHGLPMPVVITETATMDEVADAGGRVPAALRGLDRFEARERIVAQLEREGLLEKVEPHEHAVRHCYRCDTVVEPRLSDQWFVKMKPLAEPALAAVRDGRIRILPQRWEAVYINWLEGIRDWNISRQLWWGHRIPVWYCDGCDAKPIASRTDLSSCARCGGTLRQDEDVLDTWFSSWLWPISTLGWPDESAKDLRAFYPTDMLVTAPEILFFWVSRMIMAGFEFMGEAPFHTVYLTGTVRDMQHQKMSKSLGNGIDPLDVVRLYGADALRYTLIAGMGLGADLSLDPRDIDRSFAPGRNFATKLWNIARFALTSVGEEPVRPLSDVRDELTRADAWILWRLDEAIAECDAALGPSRPESGRWRPEQRDQGLRLNEYVESARRFVWNELADWYVEALKPRLAREGADREVARAVLVHVLDQALRLLHPVVPFLTETLWQRLPGHEESEFLARSGWPQRGGWDAPRAREFDLVRETVIGIRQLRSDYGIPPGAQIRSAYAPPASDGARARTLDALTSERSTIEQLTRSQFRADAEVGNNRFVARNVLASGATVSVVLEGVIDVAKECARVRSELAQTEKMLAGVAQRLANEGFVSRAPATVIEGARQQRRDLETKRRTQLDQVSTLCGS